MGYDIPSDHHGPTPEQLLTRRERQRQPALRFSDLRAANRARLPEFKNRHGLPAHSEPDGSDWPPAQWLQALVGGLGEFANIRKKYERGDLTFDEYREAASRELADVQTYLDLLAQRCLDRRDGLPDASGIDLGRATVRKFNEVSARVGSGVLLHSEGGWSHAPRGEGR